MDELYGRLKEIEGGRGDTSEIPDPEKVAMVYSHQCLSRNRRYVFAYVDHRLSKIRKLRWETGAVVPDHIAPKLSPRENDYFMEYNELLTEYCNAIQLDLTSDLEVSLNI